jgi:hypothetical protein
MMIAMMFAQARAALMARMEFLYVVRMVGYWT